MKILIVDDEPSICQCLARIARRLGYGDVDTANSGEEVLMQIAHQPYDLITLDLHMPGKIDGWELIPPVRRRFPHAILAIISGFIPEEISRKVAHSVDAMIPKPVDVDIFIQLLEKAEQTCQAREKVAK